MDIIEAINARKSIRDFKDTPVSQAVIREILEIAGRAPSAMNSQPWEFTVVANDKLTAIKQAVIEKLKAGEPPNS